jgi:hypothetical protein
LEYSVTDAEQDILNPIGVNCVRQFPASGIVVWGARTFAAQSDPEYRYVPVRRYTLYLRQSIYRGTQWAVFEPNDAPLWDQLKANIDDFLMGEFRKGALAGATPDEAFSVKCDAELNPPSEVNAGRVEHGDRVRAAEAGGVRGHPHQPEVAAAAGLRPTDRWQRAHLATRPVPDLQVQGAAGRGGDRRHHRRCRRWGAAWRANEIKEAGDAFGARHMPGHGERSTR